MKLCLGVILLLPLLVCCHSSETYYNNNKYSLNYDKLKSDIAACENNKTKSVKKIQKCDINIDTCEAETTKELNRLQGVYDTYLLSLALQQKTLDYLVAKDTIYESSCRSGAAGTTFEPFDGNTYHFHVDASDKKTWEDAETFCYSLGCELVVIEHAKENRYLKQRIEALLTTVGISQGDSTFFWTGLNNKDAEDTWEWKASETPASYTDWKVGYPIEDDDKRCGNMLWKDDKIRWANNNCDEPAFFICECPQC